MSLYAAAGIPEYWIANLVMRQVEVHRNPAADAAQPFGYRYSSVVAVQPGSRIAPLARPAAEIDVDELFI